jgi:hypothetical protein
MTNHVKLCAAKNLHQRVDGTRMSTHKIETYAAQKSLNQNETEVRGGAINFLFRS